MRSLVRGVGAGSVPAVLVMGMLLTGCSTEPRPKGPAADAKVVAETEEAAQPAVQGGTLGGAGSACVLPVSFDLAVNWKPQAVKVNPEFGSPTLGTVTLVCEIDAKPAGSVGFIRVWTGGGSGADARTALEAFVAVQAKSRKQEVYKEIKVGSLAATEVTYLNTDADLYRPKPEQMFAVTTASGVVVVNLDGLDEAEHRKMLPAYELVKKSLRAN